MIFDMFVCNCCHFTRVERIYDDINASITKRSIHVDFQLNKLALVITRVTALMGILVRIIFQLILPGSYLLRSDYMD